MHVFASMRASRPAMCLCTKLETLHVVQVVENTSVDFVAKISIIPPLNINTYTPIGFLTSVFAMREFPKRHFVCGIDLERFSGGRLEAFEATLALPPWECGWAGV